MPGLVPLRFARGHVAGHVGVPLLQARKLVRGIRPQLGVGVASRFQLVVASSISPIGPSSPLTTSTPARLMGGICRIYLGFLNFLNLC